MDTFRVELIGDPSVGLNHEFGEISLPELDLTEDEMKEFTKELKEFLQSWCPPMFGVKVTYGNRTT